MLNDLKVLNGDLELKFDKYNYEYTVKVSEDTKKLEFSFNYEKGTNIEVIHNELKDIDNIVYVKAFNDKEEHVYIFTVHKNILEDVSGIEMYKQSLEVKDKEIELYKVQILGISIFLIIVIIFSLLFRRKKCKANVKIEPLSFLNEDTTK